MSHAAGVLGATRTAMSKHQSVPCSRYSCGQLVDRERAAEPAAQLDHDLVDDALQRGADRPGRAAASRRWPSCQRPIRSSKRTGAGLTGVPADRSAVPSAAAACPVIA